MAAKGISSATSLSSSTFSLSQVRSRSDGGSAMAWVERSTSAVSWSAPEKKSARLLKKATAESRRESRSRSSSLEGATAEARSRQRRLASWQRRTRPSSLREAPSPWPRWKRQARATR